MVYSLTLLTTPAQCDAAVSVATEKLKVLTFQDTEADYRADNTQGSAKSLADELKSLNQYITAMTPVLAGLDAGKEHDELAEELNDKTHRRNKLVARQRKEGGEKLVVRELEQALLEPQPAVVQDFIEQVKAHRDTLTA